MLKHTSKLVKCKIEANWPKASVMSGQTSAIVVIYVVTRIYSKVLIMIGSSALLFSSLLAIHFATHPMLAHRYLCHIGFTNVLTIALIVDRYTPVEAHKTLIVIVTELCKIVLAALSILIFSSPKERSQIFLDYSFLDSLKVAALPATLYAIQNVLTQYAYDGLSSLTFNLLNQTKVIFI